MSDAGSFYRATVRQRLVVLIEQAIDLLDRIDGDSDFEPSLGWSRTYAIGSADDREIDEQDMERIHAA